MAHAVRLPVMGSLQLHVTYFGEECGQIAGDARIAAERPPHEAE